MSANGNHNSVVLGSGPSGEAGRVRDDPHYLPGIELVAAADEFDPWLFHDLIQQHQLSSFHAVPVDT